MAAPANLALIGMPASGKSTLGVLAAKALGWDFLDTDVHIQVREGRPLRAIIAEAGLEAFCQLEAAHLLALAPRRCVIATGGSAVLSPRAMAHLRGLARVVWLEVGLDALNARIGDLRERGVIHRPGQRLAEILAEREPLYRRYAHRVLPCDALTPEQIVAALADLAQ